MKIATNSCETQVFVAICQKLPKIFTELYLSEELFLACRGDELLQIERLEVGGVAKVPLVEFPHCRSKHCCSFRAELTETCVGMENRAFAFAGSVADEEHRTFVQEV